MDEHSGLRLLVTEGVVVDITSCVIHSWLPIYPESSHRSPMDFMQMGSSSDIYGLETWVGEFGQNVKTYF